MHRQLVRRLLQQNHRVLSQNIDEQRAWISSRALEQITSATAARNAEFTTTLPGIYFADVSPAAAGTASRHAYGRAPEFHIASALLCTAHSGNGNGK
ncbi:hypothetical protein WJX73_009737 [Symbiochloris irregularis]|uniref:Uncharacterized protein n=1 Tax=Symbiochloris irregularis TaxID=706552 RepID=A0AAW1NSS6_9CHLO